MYDLICFVSDTMFCQLPVLSREFSSLPIVTNANHYWAVVHSNYCPWPKKYVFGDFDDATCVSPYPPASKFNKKKRKGSARLDAMHSDAATDSECDSSSDEDFCLEDLIDSETDWPNAYSAFACFFALSYSNNILYDIISFTSKYHIPIHGGLYILLLV